MYLALLVAIGIAFALRVWLLTPHFDDGDLGNTIFGTPYYNEYHKIYIPYFKPTTTLLLPLRFVPYPTSFALAVILQTMTFAASVSLLYLLARRYLSPRAAVLAGIIALYALFLHELLPPTRPEGLLLLAFLAAAYLADTWRVTGKARYLAGAAVVTGLIALPLHTNASIVYIFLGLFALWHWQRMRGQDLAIFFGTLTAASLAGLVVILAPSPSGLFALLGEYSQDDRRFTFLWSEAQRLGFLLRPAPLLAVVLFFGAVTLWTLWRERPGIIAKGADFSKRYSTIVMLGLASFTGLALLPSAPWWAYVVYHLPAAAVFAALAYERERPSRRAALGVGALVFAAIGAAAVAAHLLRAEVETWVLTGLAVGAVAAALLCVSWATGRREWLVAALVLLVIVRLGMTAVDYAAYNNMLAALRDRAAEVEGWVLGPPDLEWVFWQENFHPIFHPWYEPAPPGPSAMTMHDYGGRYPWTDELPATCIVADIDHIPLHGLAASLLDGHWKRWSVATMTCRETGAS